LTLTLIAFRRASIAVRFSSPRFSFRFAALVIPPVFSGSSMSLSSVVRLSFASNCFWR
jgi:hypothetical protein